MMSDAVLEVRPTARGRVAILFLPACVGVITTEADDTPRNGPMKAPLVNIAAGVLLYHLRDCGCDATVELEKRYAPMAVRIRAHGGWNSYDD